jgi:hypothetical protein
MSTCARAERPPSAPRSGMPPSGGGRTGLLTGLVGSAVLAAAIVRRPGGGERAARGNLPGPGTWQARPEAVSLTCMCPGDIGPGPSPDYPFTAADAGTHTFPGGFTLVTPGDQTLTATDTVSGITGSATVTVTAADPVPAGAHRRPCASRPPTRGPSPPRGRPARGGRPTRGPSAGPRPRPPAPRRGGRGVGAGRGPLGAGPGGARDRGARGATHGHFP